MASALMEQLPMEVFSSMGVDDKVLSLTRLVQTENNQLLRRWRQARPRKLRWWNRELSRRRKEVRRLRRLLQRSRRRENDETDSLRESYRRSLDEYKDMLADIKLAH